MLDQLNAPELQDVPEELTNQIALPESGSLFDLKRHTPGDGRELLKHRFLCRQGGMLWVAPTGIGKSVAAVQAMCCWSRGHTCMGIEPSGPIRSLYVQAENDEGDLAEIRDGVVKGMKWTDSECEAARESVIVTTETERTGSAFFLVLEKLLEKHHPDIVWIDPALSYLGGESSSQKDVGAWLRNGLNPLLHRYDCAAIVIHHTAKPSKTADKQAWAAGDFAYAGLGSVEWANWARGVLAIRSVGSHETFELRAGKRGSRLGWKDANGEKVFAKMIAHSKEQDEHDKPIIYWREVTGDELKTYQQPADKTPDDLLVLVPDTKQGIDKATLMAKAQVAGIPDKKARTFLLVLLGDGRLHPWEIKRKGARPAVHVSRFDQAAQEAFEK